MDPTESHPHRNIQDQLDLVRLRHALEHSPIGHTITYYERVESTMPLAHHHASDPATGSGTIIVADEQTAGRGRHTRRWETPPRQALLTSLILKTPLPIAPHEIPMAAGLAVVDAVIRCRPELEGQVGLKWPNDLLLGSSMMSAQKFGGTLIEGSFYGADANYFIVGTGINVLQDEDTLPQALPGAPTATSLRCYLATNLATMESGAPDCSRTELLIALCRAWAELLSCTGHPSLLFARWRSALWTLGHQVTLYQGMGNSTPQQQIITGEAIDVTAEGHLLIRDATGNTHRFAAGDVSVRFAKPQHDPTISRGQ